MKRIELIEFLKGYSIFTIVVYHFLQTMNWQHIGGKLIAFGGTGVHLFVLLSGFGLFLSHQSKPLNYLPFLKRRFLRIYLPYIIVVLFTALLSFIVPVYKSTLYALLGHVFLYKMFDESIMGTYGYALWFISMIIQFYLTFHLIVFVRKRLSDFGFLSLSLIVSVLWILFVIFTGNETERVWNSFFLRYLWEFSLGIFLAEKFRLNKLAFISGIKTGYFLLFGIANCVLYAILALKGGETGKMLNDIPALFGYSSIAIWLYLMKNKLINNFFLYTGSISYSVYLWHTFILMSVIHFTNLLPLVVSLVLAMCLVFIVASYYKKLLNLVFVQIKK